MMVVVVERQLSAALQLWVGHVNFGQAGEDAGCANGWVLGWGLSPLGVVGLVWRPPQGRRGRQPGARPAA